MVDANAPRRRIAVVGSGISGLICAHVLGPHHDVVLFEADDRLGGHANTVDVDDPAAGRTPVDTGFIVHNDRNYPNLTRLLRELEIPTVDTDMSFGVTDRDPSSPTFGFTYRASSPNSLLARRRNAFDPTTWRMLIDIAVFYRRARRFLTAPDPTLSLDQFLARGRYSRAFVELHLSPMGASVWSADPSAFGLFPALNLFTFLDNHGLLGLRDRPQWRTIVGGSRVYVEAIARRFDGQIHLGEPVLAVERRTDQTVELTTCHGREVFDAVVLAVHSDQALAMLRDPLPVERGVLASVGYQPNRATLHTDQSMLSPQPRAWSAWNYDRRGPDDRAATLTYDLTALQHLDGQNRHLVSLNSDEHIDAGAVVASFDYAHPVFDSAAIAAQQRFASIDGVGGVHFCGAWWGYGFHEDGITSGLRVCSRLGVEWTPVEP